MWLNCYHPCFYTISFVFRNKTGNTETTQEATSEESRALVVQTAVFLIQKKLQVKFRIYFEDRPGRACDTLNVDWQQEINVFEYFGD